ncbi:MAG: hypothetical protein JWM42_2203 [Burkholderia sp.]|nr:hypothetical protein [Burkholderia sp.]
MVGKLFVVSGAKESHFKALTQRVREFIDSRTRPFRRKFDSVDD